MQRRRPDLAGRIQRAGGTFVAACVHVLHPQPDRANAEVLRQRQLDVITALALAPGAFDTHGWREAVFTGHAQLAGAGIGQTQRQVAAAALQPQVQAVESQVGRPVGVAALRAGVVHGNPQVQAFIGAAGNDTHPGSRRTEGQRHRGGAAPVAVLAVEPRREVQRMHEPAVARRRQATRAHGNAARQGFGRSKQRLFLALAQQRFHLPHELPAGPGQGQDRQGDQQQFRAQAHAGLRRASGNRRRARCRCRRRPGRVPGTCGGCA